MKDAHGHGSDSRGGQHVAQQWRAAHQGGIVKRLPSLVKAFAKDETADVPINSPLVHAAREFLRAPANGGDYVSDIGSHLYGMGG